MDRPISTTEANRSFSRLLREVQDGQSYVVTSHGRPVARIVPCDEADTARRAAFEVLMERLEAQPAIDIGRPPRSVLYES